MTGLKAGRFSGLTGLGPEGCGIAFGDEYKGSVTEFTFVSPVLHGEVIKPPFLRKGGGP